MSHQEIMVDAMIEIPKGTQNKYEYDQVRGMFRLDRVLCSAGALSGGLWLRAGDPGRGRRSAGHPGLDLDRHLPRLPGAGQDHRRADHGRRQGRGHQAASVAAADPRYNRVLELRHLSPHSIREMECTLTSCVFGAKAPPRQSRRKLHVRPPLSKCRMRRRC